MPRILAIEIEHNWHFSSRKSKFLIYVFVKLNMDEFPWKPAGMTCPVDRGMPPNTFLPLLAQVATITSTQTCVAHKVFLLEHQPAKHRLWATLNAFPLILMTIIEKGTIVPIL